MLIIVEIKSYLNNKFKSLKKCVKINQQPMSTSVIIFLESKKNYFYTML